MLNNNLLINSIETEKEKYFNYKCKDLLYYYSKDSIIDICHDLEYINKQFVSDILSFDDISYILIKKYYISNHKQNYSTKQFDTCLEQLNFEAAHQLFTTNPNLRQAIFETYFDNINIQNNILSTEKAYELGYDKVNMTIVELNHFYSNKKVNNNYMNQKVLKKS